jgi:predicted signal transduction protein with EAL and GGDEF domain
MLLQEVGRRLQACVRAEDTVARIGGDEFVVMTGSLDEDASAAAQQAATVADKVLKAVGRPCQLGVHTHTVTPSVGVTLFQGQDGALEEIVKRADLAMYQAKAAGRGTVRFFDPQMQHTLDTRAALECQLRDAPAAGQLSLHFQGQVSDDGTPVGAELLLRWHHPEHGLLLPGQFLSLAEQNGMIVPIGAWVLDRACAQLAQWAVHPRWRQLRLAVNVSRRQFQHEGFVDLVRSTLARHGVAPQLLRLELREDAVQDDPAMALHRMQALTRLGVGFAVDDFGVSYSSLTHMRRLPLQQIKIARSLIARVASDAHDAAVVKTIIGIAQGMALDAVATGVETAQQRHCLRALGCTLLQGHYFGAPAPLLDFEAGLAGPPGPGRRGGAKVPIITHEPKPPEAAPPARSRRIRPPAAGAAHLAEPGPAGLQPHDADPGRELAAGVGRP